MHDILVTENVTGTDMDALRRTFDVHFDGDLWKTPEQIRRLVGDYRAIIVRNQTEVDAAMINAGKRLQVIGRAGVGLENVNTTAASEAGIVVAYAPEQNSLSVAELALGMMISLARMIPAADRSTKAGQWDRRRFTGTELFGKTLGIVGLGRIGFMTAMRARAFGMDVIVHDTHISPDAFTVVETRARLVSLAELLATADFVSCHVPETPATIGMFDDARFAQMKPSAFFLNTARGRVVNEDALVRALKDGKIAGAGIEVRATEPPAPGGPLAEMDNVILLPHIGAFTVEGQERVVSSVCRDVAAVLGGGAARNCFNFPRPKRKN
jgi:D-3-phosphoglycerate dehydrogenase